LITAFDFDDSAVLSLSPDAFEADAAGADALGFLAFWAFGASVVSGPGIVSSFFAFFVLVSDLPFAAIWSLISPFSSPFLDPFTAGLTAGNRPMGSNPDFLRPMSSVL
jgi:hypothetical protein